MTSKPAVKPAPAPESVAPREAPVLKLNQITMQSTGHLYREFVIFAPESLALSDFNENADRIWKAIQGSRGHALQEYDRVEFRWRDKVVFAIVNSADATSVTLFDIRKVSKPIRTGELWSNETYSVQWGHQGYFWARNSDGVPMSQERFTEPDAAKAACLRSTAETRIV